MRILLGLALLSLGACATVDRADYATLLFEQPPILGFPGGILGIGKVTDMIANKDAPSGQEYDPARADNIKTCTDGRFAPRRLRRMRATQIWIQGRGSFGSRALSRSSGLIQVSR